MGIPTSDNLTEEQELAILKIKEYKYRRLFHLSKAEMYNEPMEDVLFNLEIDQLFRQKEKKNYDIMKMKQEKNLK